MKSFWKSKTEWLNILAIMITIIQMAQQTAWIPVEVQVFILAVLNGLVRLLTNTSIVGTPASKV